MFTPKVMAIRMSKMTHFMYFLLNTDPVWARYLNSSKSSYLALIKKLAISNILKVITLEVNMITRQMTHFSHLLYHLVCFTSKPLKFNSMGSPFALSSVL